MTDLSTLQQHLRQCVSIDSKLRENKMLTMCHLIRKKETSAAKQPANENREAIAPLRRH